MQRALPQKARSKVLATVRLRARATHVMSKAATLTLGAAYVSPAAISIRRWLDHLWAHPNFSGRVALVAHAYYPELIGEIRACFATLPTNADLIITTPFERLDVACHKLGDVARARIVGVENRGRDIAPFLTLLNADELAPFDAVLKLHTKRSPHLRDGNIRRRMLFSKLAGSRRQTALALRLFEDPTTGLVGWGCSWRNTPLLWMDNRDRVEQLCAGMGVEQQLDPAFFEGSMFWVRPAALNRLRSLGLSTEKFEVETGQLDGALHHAVERAFAIATIADSFIVRNMHGRKLLTSKSGAAVGFSGTATNQDAQSAPEKPKDA